MYRFAQKVLKRKCIKSQFPDLENGWNPMGEERVGFVTMGEVKRAVEKIPEVGVGVQLPS
jgi:hypothetical protein